MLLAIPCAAQTCNYTVTSLADSGPGTLRAGLADPHVTDICFQAAGTITLSSTLQILYPVRITGKVTIDGSNQVKIFEVNESSGSDVVQINGLVLTQGNATSEGGPGILSSSGGALQVVQGTVALVSVTITGNTAIFGGGVYNQSTLTLSQCNISGNTSISVPSTQSFGTGGGIYNDANALVVLKDATVSKNSSTDGAGGLYNLGTAEMAGALFSGNTGSSGGAIFNDSNLLITGGTAFSNNTAALGGAIANYGTTQVTQALFTGNVAQSSGALLGEGGALYNGGTAALSESTLSSNSASDAGGAIENFQVIIGIRPLNSSGQSRAAAAPLNPGLTLVNDTLYGNSAPTGSAVDNSFSVTIHNTIIFGTQPPSCNGCANAVSTVTAENLIDVEPYLGPLAANGGTTRTMMPLPGGPAVARGDPNAIVDDTDQRGFSRLSASGSVDVGAVQSHYSAVTYLTQPSNGFINQPIAPPVAVQVLEVDGSTNNYPLGVPVVVSLFTSQGVQASSSLTGTLTQLPVATNDAASFGDLAIDTAGSYELQATIVPSAIASSASQDPAYGVMSNVFVINAAPVISWQPGPIAYGPMPAAELNATATINGAAATGTFVYTFAGTSTPITVGQIYPAGAYKVQVTFTPTGTTLQYTLETSLQINPATPVVTWPTPAAIYTSTPLGSTQLNATATGVTGAALPGTFVYNPAAGTKLTAGAHTLGTTFTPTDTANYTTATAQVTIQVNAVTAANVVLQKSADPIIFGQTETFTAVVTGADGNPFSGGTASFTVDGAAVGSAAVNNGSASVSTTSVSGGTHQVGVTYTNTTTNQTLTATGSLTVNKATPVLTWPTPAAIYTSTPLGSAQLNATATGVTGAALAGTFVYNPAAGTMLPAGSQTLNTTFTPTDITDYTTATAQVSIQVNAVTAARVVLQKSADPITFGQTETFTAVVTGADGNPFSGGTASFTVDGAVIGSAAVNNGSAAVSTSSVSGGTHPVGVTYTNTATKQTLTATGSLTVNKAAPVLTWATPAPIYTSTTLSATQLNAKATGVNGAALAGTFVYNPTAGTMLTAGSHVLRTTFTPTDTTDYSTNTAQTSIQVTTPTAASVTIQKSANPITFGKAETFTAVITGSDGQPYSGGTASFTSDGAAIGAATVVNGSASVTTSSLTAGIHQIAVSYTNSSLPQPLTGSTSLTVNKATPVLNWATPSPIYTSTPLSATQLDATATGVNSGALAGTFAYNPAAGTKLTAGSHALSTTFTPTDTTDYNTNTAQVTIQANAPTAANVAIQESANPITFGQTETFIAVITGSDGQPFSGGTASFTSEGAVIGTATAVNGSASVTTSSLTAGTHLIAVSYTNSSLSQPLTGSASLVVNKAAPVLAWPTPAPILTTTPLGSTQLDVTAKGMNGASLPGTFVYSPAAGTMLSAGSQTLSATFTPTDKADYTNATAQVTIQVDYPSISITSVSPGSATLGTTPLTITLAGSGFTSTSVVQVNGTAIATQVQSSTSLAATLPAADLVNPGTLNLLVHDSQSKLSSNAVQFKVTAPPADVTLSIPQTTGSGEQPNVTIELNNAYPSDLKGTLTLTFAPSASNGVDDPAIQLSTGGRTLNFTVPAGSKTTPQVALQTGTVAGTITVTLTLTAGGVDVTPAALTPIPLPISAAAPVITHVTFTNSSAGLITVAISGFSNTREMSQAEFVFTGTDAGHLRSSKVDVPATLPFSTWYSQSDSDQFGSEFTYTQHFQLSKPDAGVTGVSVTLANSVGTSGSVNSQ